MAEVSSGSFKTGNYEGRYLQFSWEVDSQSIANNTTTIAWTLKGAGGAESGYYKTRNIKVTIAGETVYYQGEGTASNYINLWDGTVVASGKYTFSHDAEGKKSFKASAEAGIYVWAVNCTGSGSWDLPTIPRKSTLSASNGTLGTKQTLTVTRKSSSFTHTITYKCGSASGTICTKSSDTSIEWTPPLSLASQNTTGTSVSVTFTITTYSGSTNVGSNTKTITCTIPASVKPSCTVNISDPTGYANTYGGYLKGLSKFKVAVTATTAYGSAIASYSATANGTKYTKASFTTDVLKSSGAQTVSATVKDKRGRSGSTSANISVLDYNPPVISKLTVHRCNADGPENDQGAYVEVKFSGSVTALNNKNTAAYTLEYKKSSASEYTVVKLTALNNKYSVADSSYIFAAETGSSYNVRLTVADNFSSASSTTSASTAFTLMHWLASGLGMAIGKIAELANVLDIGFQTRFMGGILHPVLEPETDLDDVRTPNTYVGANVSNYNYLNCPLDTGTFTLEVVGMGDAGQVKQRITSCRKADARAFERIYYTSAWGEWVCVSDYAGTLLWSGNYYMTADHVANLSEPISKQKSGIVIVFARYVDGEEPYAWNSFFIPKYAVDGYNSSGHTFIMTTNCFSVISTKYLYIRDGSINGNENNNKADTANGITYNNAAFTMKYVIGV